MSPTKSSSLEELIEDTMPNIRRLAENSLLSIMEALSDELFSCFILFTYGYKLPNRAKADALVTKDEFCEIISNRKYNEFQLVKLFEYDVTNFSEVDYTELFEYLMGLDKNK